MSTAAIATTARGAAAFGCSSRHGSDGSAAMKPRKIALPALALVGGLTRVALAIDPNTLPTQGAIVAGTGSISQTDRALQVDQASQNLILNWGSFNIGSAARVNFAQPSSSAVA